MVFLTKHLFSLNLSNPIQALKKGRQLFSLRGDEGEAVPWGGHNTAIKGCPTRVRNSLGSSPPQRGWGMRATDLLRAAEEEKEKGKQHNTYTSY